MAVGNYLDQSSSNSSYLCSDNQLYRPATDGGFAGPVALTPSWCALSMLFSSWDRSGRADLRVSNDRHYYGELSDGQEQLWRVAPAETPRLYTEADGWQPVRIWGMGIASDDLTDDGYPEYYLTSQGDNKLQTLTSPGEGPQFKDIALVRGVTGTRPHDGDTTLPSTAWDPAFADVNDDGLVDLFVTKGNVDEQPDYAIRDPSDLFLQQPDGTFTESAAAAGITGYPKARGAALVDLNLDGSLDLVVVNRLEPARIWRNVGDGTEAQPRAQGHWLELRLHQNGPNRDAIGGWIEVGTGVLVQSHELTVGGGHAGGDVGWIHFGLGGADHAQVRVTWPDGSQGPWTDVVADQFAIADRNSGTFERWTPPRP
jgi:hypothetical protein